MVRIEEMTYEEKVKAYNKLTKLELIKMLIESNKHLGITPPVTLPTIEPPYIVTCDGTGQAPVYTHNY